MSVLGDPGNSCCSIESFLQQDFDVCVFRGTTTMCRVATYIGVPAKSTIHAVLRRGNAVVGADGVGEATLAEQAFESREGEVLTGGVQRLA